jgi:hypothetical protein
MAGNTRGLLFSAVIGLGLLSEPGSNARADLVGFASSFTEAGGSLHTPGPGGALPFGTPYSDQEPWQGGTFQLSGEGIGSGTSDSLAAGLKFGASFTHPLSTPTSIYPYANSAAEASWRPDNANAIYYGQSDFTASGTVAPGDTLTYSVVASISIGNGDGSFHETLYGKSWSGTLGAGGFSLSGTGPSQDLTDGADLNTVEAGVGPIGFIVVYSVNISITSSGGLSGTGTTTFSMDPGVTFSSVPEPSSILLCGLGVTGLLIGRARISCRGGTKWDIAH